MNLLFDFIVDVTFSEHDCSTIELDGIDDLLSEPDRERDHGDDGSIRKRISIEVAEVWRRLQWEGTEIKANKEQLIERTEDEQDCGAGVIEIQNLASFANLLVAGRASGQHGIHVHVVGRQIQADQQLE